MGFVRGEEKRKGLVLRVHQLMQQATSRGDYKEVRRLARIAEELILLKKREQEIAQSRANLEAMLKKPVESKVDFKEVSARERGNRVRSHYVEGVLPGQGIQLKQVATKKYRTSDGLLVGITYARELAVRPSSWFLGLSEEHFDYVILLCESSETAGADIAALVLPPDFVKQIWKDLSRSKAQVKFHVARTGYMNFELRLPGPHVVNISQYLNAERLLNKSDSRATRVE